MKFQGSFPALITPFTQDKKINFNEINQLSEMHMHYSNGLVLCGSTGEGWLLSPEERVLLVEEVSKTFTKPIIVNACVWSADDFKRFIDKLGHTLDKVEAFLIAVPPYLKLNEAQVIEFYQACCQVSPKPMIAYHIPSRNNITFTTPLMEFFSEHPQVIGIKETRWSHIEDYLHLPNLIQFAGDDEFISSPLISSSINIGGNLFPEVFSQQPQTVPWHDWQKLINMANNPQIIKILMAHQGLISYSGCRAPIGRLSQTQENQIVSVFETTVQNNIFAHED